MHAGAAEPRAANGVVFRLIRGARADTPNGPEAIFQFRNETGSVVRLPCYFGAGPRDGVLQPNLVKYDVDGGGK